VIFWHYKILVYLINMALDLLLENLPNIIENHTETAEEIERE